MTQATTETKAPFEAQPQDFPGHGTRMTPKPDLGEATYKGSGRLTGKCAIITGGDSGIGAAVAIAFAREGADIVIAYLDEADDADEVKGWMEKAGRKCVLVPGDLSRADHCATVVDRAVAELGGLDILLNNAAYQKVTSAFEDIAIEEWDRTFQTNIDAMFYITKFVVSHMKAGGAIVNTPSVNAKKPMASLLPYSATKAAIANFTSVSPNRSRARRSGSTPCCPAPSGHLSSPPAWREVRSRASVRRRRSDVPVSRPSSPRPT